MEEIPFEWLEDLIDFNLLLPTSPDVLLFHQRSNIIICAHCDDIIYNIDDFENHINHPDGCPIVKNPITLEEYC